jgi:nitroimidazol reductase NimA-like FMN-containing flavoprotein (pyridoxamine 5'-phosphate oxidase superfamily)
MSEFPITDRNQVRRVPKRGHYDSETVYRILDEGLICHVGFLQDQQPIVIPTLYARRDSTLLLHGAKTSRMLQHIQAGHPVSVAVTLVDGLVVARSVYHHSMNYRSVVVFGRGSLIEGDEEKLRALEVLTEHILRGRWRDARLPNRQELDATSVVAINIESASAKVRTGPPVDDEEDYQLPIWAGVIPLRQQALTPVADPRLGAGIPVPGYAARYDRTR